MDWNAIPDFVLLGVEHILPAGLDHMLFIAAMFLSARSVRGLILQVSLFTLAHTAALGLASVGWIDAPASIVEPLIALSISVVALEGLLRWKGQVWRHVVVFGFGLFHGLGFAASIRGMFEGSELLFSLLAFNVGVEIGQLAVLAMCGAFAAGIRAMLKPVGHEELWERRLAPTFAILIAVTGGVWFVQRAFGL